MNKKALLALLPALCLLSGCSPLAREYVSVHDYVPTVQEARSTDGKINVRNYGALRQALLNMAYAGETEGSIVFDAVYEGDVTEDMASACWAVRTQDALCAYCVENIAYDLNKIVTISEASISISYSRKTESPENIRHLAFSSEAETEILNAMDNGEPRLTLLVGRSSFTADDMAAQVLRTYRENPTILAKEPTVSVTIYSGTGAQRLYEISIRYGMSAEEMEKRRGQMQQVAPFAEWNTDNMSEAERALEACLYLTENCALSDENGQNSAYDALVGCQADSEGIAFAYMALCRQLGMDCRIVYGQRDWLEHCWNIVRVDGNYYHVDVAECILTDLDSGFLYNDESFWGNYRWDVSAYPKCQGELHYADLLVQPAGEAEEPEEEAELSDGEGMEQTMQDVEKKTGN